MKVPITESEASIVNRKFTEVVKYQDSRGFVIYANELFATESNKLNEPTRTAIEADLQQLLTKFQATGSPRRGTQPGLFLGLCDRT